MTNQRLNRKRCFPTGVGALFCAVVVILFTTVVLASGTDENLLYRTTYTSFSEFAMYSCLPCHYNNSTTNLIPVFKEMEEKQFMEFLEEYLWEGNMPPDEGLRDVLQGKFMSLKKRLQAQKENRR